MGVLETPLFGITALMDKRLEEPGSERVSFDEGCPVTGSS